MVKAASSCTFARKSSEHSTAARNQAAPHHTSNYQSNGSVEQIYRAVADAGGSEVAPLKVNCTQFKAQNY